MKDIYQTDALNKNRSIGINNAIKVSGNVCDQFEEKDSYTTNEVVEAVENFTMDMGMKIVISYPIPITVNGALRLVFFLFIINSRGLLPPFCRVESPVNTYHEIESIKAEPKEFNLNILPEESLGNLEVVHRNRPFRGELPYGRKGVPLWETYFYSKMDELRNIYPREPETLNESEKDTVTTYFELFVSLIQPPFLPAYRSLNPHFFDWLEAVLGYEVDPLLGPQNVATEYHAVDNIPVKLIPTRKGELEFFALNMQTGEFQRDMSYLPFFTAVSYDYIERVQHFTESQFDAYVSEVRKTISK
jgi:hypothetical protein